MVDESHALEDVLQGLAIVTLAVGFNGLIDEPGLLDGAIVAIGAGALVVGTAVAELNAVRLMTALERGVLGAGILFFLAPLPSRFGTPSPAKPFLGGALVAIWALMAVVRRVTVG